MPFLAEHPPIKIIQAIARRKELDIYLVGGYLRDHLLGIAKDDFDFAVERNALKVAHEFAQKIRGAFVLLDRDRGCARVVKKLNGNMSTYDFADFRAKTIKGDLALRDFTINTLSVDLSAVAEQTDLGDVICDFKRGIKDINDRRIKRVSIKIFKDDPLRMMRAFSLKAVLGFKIELKTLNQIRRDKDLIAGVSYERIREELFKILDAENSAPVIKSMDRAGLLERIIPQIKVMAHCKQGTYHHLDVWPHSLEALVQLEKIFEQTKSNSDIADYLQQSLGGNRSRKSLMKLAVLLHDIGKPDTRKIEQGRVSFHGHEHVGRNIVKHIAKMLKLSVRERYALEDLVRWHLRPGYLSNFKQPSEKAVYRYFRDTKEEAVSTLLLSLADQRATRGPATTLQDQKHHESICLGLVKRYFEKKNEKPFVRLINGEDLIRKLKLNPSPIFGKILTEIEEQQSLGKIQTKAQAIQLAKKLAKC